MPATATSTGRSPPSWPTGAVAGAVVGTHLLDVLSQRTLSLLFAAILFVSAVRLFVATDADGRAALTVLGAAAMLLVGFVTGTFAGLLGVGGGVVMVPAMILLFGITPVVAKGTSAAVAIPAALMGTWRNRRRGNADLRAAAIVGVSGIVTAAIGGTLADHMSDDLSNVLFAVAPARRDRAHAVAASSGSARQRRVRDGRRSRSACSVGSTRTSRPRSGRSATGSVVWVEHGGRTASGFRGVPLSSATSSVVETAARTARDGEHAARGRAGLDGRRHRRGHRRPRGVGPARPGARRLLGHRADDRRRRRPGRRPDRRCCSASPTSS